MKIQVDKLKPSHCEQYKLWEYCLDDEENDGETAIRPVLRKRVSNMSNRIVVTDVELANGERMLATLSDISPNNVLATEQFLGLSVWKRKWITLERYFEYRYKEMGPRGFARALGLSVAEVFPIRYDISRLVRGDKHALAGEIPAKPKQRLSFTARLKLGAEG